MRYVIALLALIGLIDSGLALRVHYQDPNAPIPFCAVSEHFDCGQVNHSRYSVFPPTEVGDDPATAKGFHIPVAAAGVAGYLLILGLALANRIWWVLHASEIGFFSAGMLTYLEAFVMEKWCIYCVWSQTIMTLILLLTIATLVMEHRKRKRPSTEHSAVVVAHD